MGRESMARLRLSQRAKGLCERGLCLSMPIPGFRKCSEHKAALNRKAKRRYHRRLGTTICVRCGADIPYGSGTLCEPHRLRKLAQQRGYDAKRKAQKQRVRLTAAHPWKLASELSWIEQSLKAKP